MGLTTWNPSRPSAYPCFLARVLHPDTPKDTPTHRYLADFILMGKPIIAPLFPIIHNKYMQLTVWQAAGPVDFIFLN